MRAIRVYRGILVHPTSKEQWKEEGEEGLGRNKDKDKPKTKTKTNRRQRQRQTEDKDKDIQGAVGRGKRGRS